MGSISAVHDLSREPGIQTRGRWVRSTNAASVLCSPPSFGVCMTHEIKTGGGNFPLCIKICLKYRRYGGRQSCTNRSVALGSNPMHIIFVCFNFYVLELWCGKDENKHKKEAGIVAYLKKIDDFRYFDPFHSTFFVENFPKLNHWIFEPKIFHSWRHVWQESISNVSMFKSIFITQICQQHSITTPGTAPL